MDRRLLATAQGAGAGTVDVDEIKRVRIARAVTGDRKRERRVEVPARVHVAGGRDGFVGPFGHDRDVGHGNKWRKTELFFRPVQKVFGARQRLDRKRFEVRSQARQWDIEVGGTLQYGVEVPHRRDRRAVVIVLRDAARAAARVRADGVDQHLLEHRRGSGVGVSAPPIDLFFEAVNAVGGQTDAAVTDSTVPQVQVVFRDRQGVEIRRLRRLAGAADLPHGRVALEVHDVGVRGGEAFFVRADPDGADCGQLARVARRQRVPYDFPALEVGEVGRRKLQIVNEESVQFGLEVRRRPGRCRRGDDPRTKRQCEQRGPKHELRHLYSRYAPTTSLWCLYRRSGRRSRTIP